MTEAELLYKKNEYSKRHSFWTAQALEQFGYSINLFTTITIGFLGYLVSIRDKFPDLQFYWDGEIHWPLVLYFSTLITLFISIAIGFVSILSRLTDFRISRHLSLTRKRLLSQKKNVEEDKIEDKERLINSGISDTSKYSYYETFKNNVIKKIDFINQTDFKNIESMKEKFERLRAESRILGDITWAAHKTQIIFFLIAIFMYCITFIK
ncbi:MAG: hypothetical protein KIT51_04955 [Cyclobacteriaceae bacterium]|nr:MAG: hypothetical protein KIT51_04955 [Cyclobacteriaceae bacterium]